MDLSQILALVGLPIQAVLIIIIIVGYNKFKEQNDKFELNNKKFEEQNNHNEEVTKKLDEMKTENAKTEYATVSTFGNGKKQEYWDNKKNWTK